MNTRNKDAGPAEESIQSASPWVSKSFVFGAGFIVAIIVALAFVLASVWGKSPASVTSPTQSGENASTAADNAPPACELGVTGMKPLTAPPASVDASFGFPRVSGDEPPVSCVPAPSKMFSPRERG